MEIEEISYEKLEELRIYLRKSRQRLYTCQKEYKKLVEENRRYKNELTGTLKSKRAGMLQDKELREKYEITNQRDWKTRIDELTSNEEEENQVKIDTMNYEEDEMADDQNRLRLTINDTEWELGIALAYYTGMNTVSRPVTAIKGGV